MWGQRLLFRDADTLYLHVMTYHFSADLTGNHLHIAIISWLPPFLIAAPYLRTLPSQQPKSRRRQRTTNDERIEKPSPRAGRLLKGVKNRIRQSRKGKHNSWTPVPLTAD